MAVDASPPRRENEPHGRRRRARERIRRQDRPRRQSVQRLRPGRGGLRDRARRSAWRAHVSRSGSPSRWPTPRRRCRSRTSRDRAPPGDDAEPLVAEIRSFFGGDPGGPCLLKSVFPLPDLTPHGCTLMGHPPLMLRARRLPLPAPPPDLQIVASTTSTRDRLRGDVGARLPRADVATVPRRVRSSRRARSTRPGGITSWATPTDAPVAAGSCYVDDHVLRVENIAVMADTRGRGFGARDHRGDHRRRPRRGRRCWSRATSVDRSTSDSVFARCTASTYWLVPR